MPYHSYVSQPGRPDSAKVGVSGSPGERFLGLGAIPHGSTVEEFTAFLDGERKKWGPVAQKVGLKPN